MALGFMIELRDCRDPWFAAKPSLAPTQPLPRFYLQSFGFAALVAHL